MSSQCTILFDNNPDEVYYSGQTVSGTIELVTTKEKTIRAIYITINGFAHVRWTEIRTRKAANGKTEKYTQTVRGDEQYLSSRTIVLGQDTGNYFELKPGKYVYSFEVHLPSQVPASFNGLYGQIRYEVILTVDRPWKYDNIFRRPFSVISPFDLNVFPIYRVPNVKKEEKDFCCGSCFYFKNDPIIAQLIIPYSGFVPGQNIDFKVFVGNESKIDCREVKIKLLQTVQFISKIPEIRTRTECVKVTEKKLGPVLKLSRKEFQDILKIPSIAPSSLHTCSIIKTSYTIDVVVKIYGLHTNINLSVPVAIGTVPLAGTMAGSTEVVTTQPRLTQVNGQGELPPPYSAFGSPVFEEAVKHGQLFIDKDEEEKYGKTVPFIPKYPVYHGPNMPVIFPNHPHIGHTNKKKLPKSPTPNDINRLGIISDPNNPNPLATSIYPTVPSVKQLPSSPAQTDTKSKPIGWNA